MGWTEGQTVELIDGKMDGRRWLEGRKERKVNYLIDRQMDGQTD